MKYCILLASRSLNNHGFALNLLTDFFSLLCRFFLICTTSRLWSLLVLSPYSFFLFFFSLLYSPSWLSFNSCQLYISTQKAPLNSKLTHPTSYSVSTFACIIDPLNLTSVVTSSSQSLGVILDYTFAYICLNAFLLSVLLSPWFKPSFSLTWIILTASLLISLFLPQAFSPCPTYTSYSQHNIQDDHWTIINQSMPPLCSKLWHGKPFHSVVKCQVL